jgi:hypothetical protein
VNTAAQVLSKMELKLLLYTSVIILAMLTKAVYYILQTFGIAFAVFTTFVQDIFVYLAPIVLIAFSDTVRVMLICSLKGKTYNTYSPT